MKSVDELVNEWRERLFVSKDFYVTTIKLRDGHVQDETQSVAWNREYVQENNAKHLEQLKQYRKAQSETVHSYHEELVSSFADEEGITVEEAQIIFNYAYAESHSSGYNDVMITASEIAGVVSKIKELN